MLESLKRDLHNCQIVDRHRLRRKIFDLGKLKQKDEKFDSRLKAVAEQIEKSKRKTQLRAHSIPQRLDYPPLLPVSESADEIADLIRRNPVVVVAGDTGSGKTTQLPKICLQAGYGLHGLIGHTQPRRLAAVSVSNRIAEELSTEPGQGVGYQVRFNEKTSEKTFLKLMTDGILLAEIQQDRFLNKYEVIIIDEAHERSLNIDFLLGFLKQLLRQRKDLKVIITSATIDVEKFSRHFDDAPIVSVSGRTYPVETRYAPLSSERDTLTEDDVQIDGIITSLREIESEDKKQNKITGDVLVFLSSEREIRETANKLRKANFKNTEVLPLYARLRHSEQLKVFRQHSGRRIILATNVAETSITVPGINYVIDTGFARISRYSLQSKVQRLPIEAVSQASANQRQGRCGRLANGICIRLYSEEDFNSRSLYTDPEIRRTNLASVILRMKHLRLGEIEDFPFLEPPESKAVNEGYKLLIELNALTPMRELTASGTKMAALPVDPKYARMAVLASEESCLREILIIISALSIQDPREVGAENRQIAMQKLSRFTHPESDFLGFVNLWDEYEKERQQSTQGQLKRYCKSNFLSYMRMREWREVHRQLITSCQSMGLRVNRESASYSSIHLSIIGGSLNQIGCAADLRSFVGSRNRKFTLFPSSVLSKGAHKWIVTGGLIETSQIFASLAAKIEPQWIEQMALHLVKREYFEPHWSKKRQEVMAYEKVILYGLVIAEKSLISFAAIDPAACREIFLQDGLAAGQLNTQEKFYSHNLELIRGIEKEEEKLRRPDLIISERQISRFYEENVPADICSTRGLESWLGKDKGKRSTKLFMKREKLLAENKSEFPIHEFPDRTSIHKNQLKIDYLFSPGDVSDGATVEIPISLLNQVQQADIDWAVPGIVNEKCIALIKGLPKSLRKNFIPVNAFVEGVTQQMCRADGDLLDSLIAQVRNSKQIELTANNFSEIELPGHLVSKIKVIGSNGEQLAFGNDLNTIRMELGEDQNNTASQTSKEAFQHELERSGLKDWDFDGLPEQIELGDELVLLRYPALIDTHDSIAIELLSDKQQAKEQTTFGLLRLYMLQSVQQRNLLQKKFSRFVKDKALIIPRVCNNLADDALRCCYLYSFDLNEVRPRSKAEFEDSLQKGKAQLVIVAERLERILIKLFEDYHDVSRRIANLPKTSDEYLKVDLATQIDELVYDDFLSETGTTWLREYSRYFEAIKIRLEKIGRLGEKDRLYTEELEAYWRHYQVLKNNKIRIDGVELQLFRWMIEELRVSLFAQTLGTKLPVSAKRLDRQQAKLNS